MNHIELVETQRVMRRKFFEGPQSLRWGPARELAAELLLYLDDPQACWSRTTEWLREEIGADRSDGGFGGFVDQSGSPVDYVVEAESLKSSAPMVSVLGTRFDANDSALKTVWGTNGPCPIEVVSQARSLSISMRDRLTHDGVLSKLSIAVRTNRPIGLLCVDWSRERPSWNSDAINYLGEVVATIVAPMLDAATSFKIDNNISSAIEIKRDLPVFWGQLTPAEKVVAQHIGQGLNYKEVARTLGRSLSTIDHQLRSIRAKAGVATTAKLMRLLGQYGIGGQERA